MTHSATEPKNNRTRVIVLVVAIAVVLGLIVFALTRNGTPNAAETPSQSQSPSALVTPPKTLGSPAPLEQSAKPTPTTDPALADCTAVSEGFVPNRFTVERFGADEPIVALDLDGDGNIAAPPLDEARMASWWSGGPQPGSDKGKAVLSIHTYRNGGALGNEFYDGGESRFQAGDIFKLYGDQGQVQCYRYTEATKIWVKDYDPHSDVMVDFEGKPQLAIVICWDFKRSNEDWESRVFFYFDPVTV